MKRLLALGAVSLMFAGSAFAAPCQLETWHAIPDCDRITYVEYQALPMTCCEPIVEPDPCCCKKKVEPCGCENRSFMGKFFDGTRTVYDSTFGNVIGFLSGR